MKRKLLLNIIAILTFGVMTAQQIAGSNVISIVGSGVNGWPGEMEGPEIDLVTTDNVTFTISGLTVTTGEIKFRQNHDWGTNWGNNSNVLSEEFPSGTATLNGGNIQTLAGTYDVTFNINTLEYNFVGSQLFFNIGVWGPAVDPILGYLGDDAEMLTNDGINYILSGFNFTSGPAKFRQNDDDNITWGDVDFPVGVAYPDGPPIVVEGGLYTVRFNWQTGEYSFQYPSIGIIGSAVNGWDQPDVDMTTTDGNIYILNNQMINGGELKFRQDDMWMVSWGGSSFPEGTTNDSNIMVPAEEAGMYNISFNRAEGTYSFWSSLGVNDAHNNTFHVFPNPSQNTWNIQATGAIDSIQVVDITGKVVYTAQPNLNIATIDASGLQSGIYFAKIANASNLQTVKLIRR